MPKFERIKRALTARQRISFANESLAAIGPQMRGWLLGSVMVLAACQGDDHCLGIGTEVRPAEAYLLVGQQFRAEVWEVSCDGTDLGERTVLWFATDTAVVRVDSLTGQVTATGIGIAEVVARDTAFSGYDFGAVAVEVGQP